MITRNAKAIFSAYRRDDYADPDSFVLQLGLVLEPYADEVIDYVCSPRTGIQRRCKFPPAIAEVVEACEAEATAVETRRRYASIPKPEFKRLAPPRAPGSLATIFVHADHRGYAEMVERAKGADPRFWKLDEAGRPGIWVAFNWYDGFRNGGGRPMGFALYTDEPLRAMYPPRVNEPAAEGAEF